MRGGSPEVNQGRKDFFREIMNEIQRGRERDRQRMIESK